MKASASLALLLLTVCHSYYLDEKDYFYVNSSYSRQTISYSMCFHFEEEAQIIIESPILNPNQNHTVLAKFTDQVQINFDPPFDKEKVGYNNFGGGEYWFGIKQFLIDGTESNFERITLTITTKGQTRRLELLSPLNIVPMSAFPMDSLYKCGEKVLLSFTYQFQESDVYLYSQEVNFYIEEQSDWGFRHSDGAIAYLRHKDKKNGGILTVVSDQPFITKSCKLVPKLPHRHETTLTQQSNNLKDLLKYALPLSYYPVSKGKNPILETTTDEL